MSSHVEHSDSRDASSTPSNVVDNPILNSPFEEPAQHFDFSGASPRVLPGRRAAGYYGLPRTDQVTGAIARNPFIPLPTVNEIRARVREWRAAGWPGVTPTTRDLLEYWHHGDRRPLFFCQREAAETIIWLTEATAADRQGLDIEQDLPVDRESEERGYKALRRYCAKMATGSGKTVVMAMIAAWSILNKLVAKQDPRFSDAVLVVGPNLTIKDRLRVLDPKVDGNYYAHFDLVPRSYLDLLARGRVFVTNWHAFAIRDDSRKIGVVKKGRESDAAFVRRVLGRDLGSAGNLLVINDEAHHAYRPVLVDDEEAQQQELAQLTADERRDAEEQVEEATVWIGGLDRIHAVRGVRMVLDLSATPFYLKGSGRPEGSPMPWIVSDFGLVDAIESGITKIPRIPIADDSGRPDPRYFRLWQQVIARLGPGERPTGRGAPKPEAVWREAQGALSTLAAKWQSTRESFEASRQAVPPVLIVVAANTKISGLIAEAVQRGDVLDALKGEHTFGIDSKVLAEAEAADGGTVDQAKERLRLKTSTVGKASWPDDRPPEGFEDLIEPPGKNVRCVVSVGMLTEGWDAPNVTQILGLRAFSSQLLCEQVVGRGLRRMSYQLDPATGRLEPEYCDVFGVPFEVVPVQGSTTQPAPPGPAQKLVQALAERKHLAIEFPRVEGFVRQVRKRLRCDVGALPELNVDPQAEPTETLVRSDLAVLARSGRSSGAGGGEILDRDRYHQEHRVQRTAFEIAADVIARLAGEVDPEHPGAPDVKIDRRVLFPQVLGFVRQYIDDKVRLSGAAQLEDVALERYRGTIRDRLLAAIEGADEPGEESLLPRIERTRDPVGSTAGVQFRTLRPTVPTTKSHVSDVVLDSNWEGSAAWYLERSEFVVSYVRNVGLEFAIPWEHQDRQRSYEPDFIVVIDVGEGRRVHVILEVKGFEDEEARSKRVAAERWVRAVNRHGGFGVWDYRVCKDANGVPASLEQARESARRAPESMAPPSRQDGP